MLVYQRRFATSSSRPNHGKTSQDGNEKSGHKKDTNRISENPSTKARSIKSSNSRSTPARSAAGFSLRRTNRQKPSSRSNSSTNLSLLRNFNNPGITVFHVDPSRGSVVLEKLLGKDLSRMFSSWDRHSVVPRQLMIALHYGFSAATGKVRERLQKTSCISLQILYIHLLLTLFQSKIFYFF